MKCIVALVACALLSLGFVHMASASFDPKRVRFINSVQPKDGTKAPNLLFRGNLPVTNGTFPLDTVIATLSNAAQEQGHQFPKQFYFVDLSLLDPLEFKDELVLIEFFKNNPNVGKYINWITVGDLIGPSMVLQPKREKMAKNISAWQPDNLPEKMNMLDNLLEATYDIPRVFYIHCEAGMDRTGEMSGSYYLHALNMTFKDALAIDNSIETRNISIYSQNAFQWYCYYLQYTTEAWRDCTLP
eukprot:m.355908 g.355908  ORF g.355908 m.355908 type:complete len:243 (+) comp17384_c0_seq1:269-997(+)